MLEEHGKMGEKTHIVTLDVDFSFSTAVILNQLVLN